MQTILAQSNLPVEQVQRDLWWGVFWVGGIVLVTLVLFLIVSFVWRRTNRSSSDLGAGFSLSELRAMRDRGELKPEEYEILRNRAVAAVSAGAIESKPASKSGDSALQ